jgi:hypothetical protein
MTQLEQSEREHSDETEKENLVEVLTVNDTPVHNIFCNRETNKFYTKCKKKVVVEVDDIKPIAWRNIQNTYVKRNGDTSNYSYKYVNLQGHRLRQDELAKAIVYKSE